MGTKPTSFGFSTKPYDEETGLNYYRYRYYNPTFGRWLSRDPIAEQGFKKVFEWKQNQSKLESLYIFVSNNPITSYDMLGLIDPLWVTLVNKYVRIAGWFRKGLHEMPDMGVLKKATKKQMKKFYRSFIKDNDQYKSYNVNENVARSGDWMVGGGDYTSATGLLGNSSNVWVKGKADIDCKKGKKIGTFKVKWEWHDDINGKTFEEWENEMGTNPYTAAEPYLHLIFDVGLGFEYKVIIFWKDSSTVKVDLK